MQQPVLAKAAKAALDDGPEASASLKFTKGSAHKVSMGTLGGFLLWCTRTTAISDAELI